MSADVVNDYRDRQIQRLARELDRVDRLFTAYQHTREENPELAESFREQSFSHFYAARAIQRQIARVR